MTQHPARSTGRVLRGCGAGVVATAAMSAWMLLLERHGPMRGQPPRMVVDRLLPVDGGSRASALAVVAHVAYGAAAGGAFGLLRVPRRGSVAAGVGFGVLLWAAGYEGWLPILRVLPPAHRDDTGRVAVMIGAHALYGGVLGRLAHR